MATWAAAFLMTTRQTGERKHHCATVQNSTDSNDSWSVLFTLLTVSKCLIIEQTKRIKLVERSSIWTWWTRTPAKRCAERVSVSRPCTSCSHRLPACAVRVSYFEASNCSTNCQSIKQLFNHHSRHHYVGERECFPSDWRPTGWLTVLRQTEC